MVTYTWEKGPLGDWQVAGSLTRTLTVAMAEVGVVEPDDPVEVLLQATTMKAAAIRNKSARITFHARGKLPARRGAVMVPPVKISGSVEMAHQGKTAEIFQCKVFMRQSDAWLLVAHWPESRYRSRGYESPWRNRLLPNHLYKDAVRQFAL
jgi:hypothetical protein